QDVQLGGNLRHIRYLQSGDDPQTELQRLIRTVDAEDRIRVFLNARVEEVEGSVGSFRTKISVNGDVEEVQHGVVIVATGAAGYRPTEYLYGQDERVITQLELEERLASSSGWSARSNGGPPRTVVMIQCVGSRDAERPYCSRLCCAEAMKNALKIKDISPTTNVYVLYRDIRTYGFRERYYTEARRRGVAFIRYEPEEKPDVCRNGKALLVKVVDQTLKLPVEIAADLVVLSTGIVPGEGAESVAKLLKVPLTSDGFFLEAHMKLRPVDFATDGVFLCGLAHSAKGVEESLMQAQAAAARAAKLLSRDRIELEPTISELVVENCDGCAYCVDPCPFHAITLIEFVRKGSVKKIVEINEAVCKGCGCCQATCPKQGVVIKGFKLEQLRAQVHAALGAA
ncbi:MAG: CoB--CoM heterodisulfide reductase iron-sulfur subunit A family protein, partial [Gemmatimonadales bacterium]